MAEVSFTSAGEMLLWLRFREHQLEIMHFENVVVAKVSLISALKMLLWLSLVGVGFFNVAVAIVLGMLEMPTTI